MTVEGKLLLVRHGQTSANIDQVWHGHTDTPLTELGQRQAARLGQGFHRYLRRVDAIYASPLQRARITAEQIAGVVDQTVRLDSRLMEFGVGDWEGRSFEDLLGKLGFFQAMMSDQHHRAPGGESRHEVTSRFVSAVEEMRSNHHPDDNIVVVAHGVAIAFALAYWLENDSAKWVNYRLNNTSVTAIDLARGEIEYLDRTDHL